MKLHGLIVTLDSSRTDVENWANLSLRQPLPGLRNPGGDGERDLLIAIGLALVGVTTIFAHLITHALWETVFTITTVEAGVGPPATDDNMGPGADFVGADYIGGDAIIGPGADVVATDDVGGNADMGPGVGDQAMGPGGDNVGVGADDGANDVIFVDAGANYTIGEVDQANIGAGAGDAGMGPGADVNVDAGVGAGDGGDNVTFVDAGANNAVGGGGLVDSDILVAIPSSSGLAPSIDALLRLRSRRMK